MGTAVLGTVYGVALNYRARLGELAAAFNRPPHGALPRTPVLFIKTPNTLIGPDAPVPLPNGVASIQPGPALGVFVARRAHRLTLQDAPNAIAGYAVVNEISVDESNYFRPPVASKCRDGFCAVGASMVPASVRDPHALGIRLYVNGALRQLGSTADFVYRIPELLVFMTEFMTLRAGDLVITGTPAGRVNVGPGDALRVEIDGLGSLENLVVDEPNVSHGESGR
jgi:5-oxopent-3-ene-1,2,5-tricarboxylate decarboxylase / 2-hydroxyhepta-2,4-diene-1,7-dioate isomerase